MALKNINPTQTESWKKLSQHFDEIEQTTLKQLFVENPSRKDDFSIQFSDLELDFSKNRITKETLDLLVDLADEVQLTDAIEKYFSGDKINKTEDRAVLHTALRSTTEDAVFVDEKDIKPQIQTALRKVRAFSNKVISGKWKGYTGKKITDVVNIGIGGSDLGPRMVVDALSFYKNQLNTHFVSNVDGDHIAETLKSLNPETTLFVIVSKTFTTLETMTNASYIRDWFLRSGSIFDIAKHFVAVSTNLKAATEFGIDKKNIFPMWNWVGGRFSLWSSVGLSISLALGFENFRLLLDGAEEMDIHFKETPFKNNIPVVLALLSVWYNNFYKTQSELVLPYSQYLEKLPSFLQQMVMESNGKSVDRNGDDIEYQTGNIIWGSVGTNSQHAFMQLIHQGTKIVPADFIGFKESLHGIKDAHKKLMANLYGQVAALAFGKTKEEAHLDLKTKGDFDNINLLLPHKVFEGNKPSNILLFDKLTPASLGKLIALYEHKTFVQGVIWNIFSFDQFGVELGKELANKTLKKA